MLAHVLLTYGPRPRSGDDIRHHPEMRTQFLTIQAMADDQQIELSGWIVDYCRCPRGLANLPKLHDALQHRRNVFVDSLVRIIRTTEPRRRGGLIAELREFGTHIYCAHSKAWLCEIDDPRIIDFAKSSGLKRKLARAADILTGANKTRTESARVQSSANRKMRSRKIVKQMEAIRAELRAASKKGTGDEIASVANERGLRTQSGTEWTGAAVRQVLRKLSGAAVSTGVPDAIGPADDGQSSATG